MLDDLASNFTYSPSTTGENVREIKEAKIGAIIYSIYHENTHVGYIVDKNKVLHVTIDKGVKI